MKASGEEEGVKNKLYTDLGVNSYFRTKYTFVQSLGKKNGKQPGATKTFHKKPFDPARLEDNLLDSYLSRILHKILPHAPKGKFTADGGYVSRFPSLDGKKTEVDYLRHQTTYDLFCGKHPDYKENGSEFKLDGILKSLVYNSIIANGDQHLGNFVAYKTNQVNVFKTAAFDMEYSLQKNLITENLSRTKEIINISKTEIDMNVAEALAASSIHCNLSLIENFQAQKGLKIVARSLEKELSDINSKQEAALITTFKEVISEIKQHEPDAFQKTLADTMPKIDHTDEGKEIPKYLSNFRKQLFDNLTKFEGFINQIEGDMEKGSVVVRDSSLAQPNRRRSHDNNEPQFASRRFKGVRERSNSASHEGGDYAQKEKLKNLYKAGRSMG